MYTGGKTMKRTVLLVLALLLAVGLGISLRSERRQHQDTRVLYQATRASEDSLRQSFEAAVDAIAMIQDSLLAIMPSESQVMHLSRNIESGGKMSGTRSEEILQRISDLKAGIQTSKQMIHKLEERLAESEGKILGLERLVENLKQMVAQREETITNLFARVDSLRIRVGALETDVATGQKTIEEQKQVIQERDKELSTIYYVIGTKKSLVQLGIVRESGGFIGLGKTSQLSGTMDQKHFRPLDTDVEKVLRILGKKPAVLSGQSLASYKLVPTSPDRAELRITNPVEFRKVRYLVIQVE
jgi:predicted  nucleic acid-binding Zn-ribbon protein